MDWGLGSLSFFRGGLVSKDRMAVRNTRVYHYAP